MGTIWDSGIYCIAIATAFTQALKCRNTRNCAGKALPYAATRRHGIVLTASYPAKRMGVKTGMPIWEAKQHCRDLIIVPASFGKYQKDSGYVREVFNDYTDQVESFGLDEAWLDITGSVGLFGSPVKIAKEISVRIKRELGITVSIGVSFNKITAKLGSDYKKPDAITVIEPDTYKQIVYPLPVGDLLYVGNATQRKLGSYGIRTIGQLAETNPEVLKGWFGVMGYTLSAFARGLDQTPVAKQDAHSAIKSVGNSATTPRDLTTDEDVWLMLVLLSEKASRRSSCSGVRITFCSVSSSRTSLSLKSNGFFLIQSSCIAM